VWTAAREGARYATTVGDSDGNGVPNYLDCDQIIQTALAKVVGMTLATGDILVEYSDLTDTPVADCDDATALPEPSPGGTSDIDNGFTITVTANGEFNAVVPVTSAFLDGIDLSSTQTRSIFKGVIGE
jgi:hypothetical protein